MEKPIPLEELPKTDIETPGEPALAQPDGLSLDPALDKEARLAHVLENIENPRRFRVGGLAVELEFTPEGPSLEEAFTEFLFRLKSGLAP